MGKLLSALLLLLVPCCLCLALDGMPSAGECRAPTKTKRHLSLSVRRKVDESDGRWVSAFSAWRVDPEGSSGDMTLDATHRRTECDGLAEVRIEAFIKEIENVHVTTGEGTSSRNLEPLIFHPRHGKNAVILDEGRSVQKLELEDPHNAVVFTKRPLKTDELFEIRLEKRTTKNNHCLGIGIMTHSPENVTIRSQMFTHSNGTWMYHNNAIYQNSGSIFPKYGHNLNSLQVRERVGVMRRDNGDLHFFVNGVDQGRAASNIPERAYGIVELWNDAVKVKIIY